VGVNEKNHIKQNLVLLLLYTFAFFSIWAIYEIFFRSIVHNDNTVLNIIIRNSIKIMVWTVPVLVILKYYYKVNPISYLKLDSNIKKGVVWGIIVGLLFVMYGVASNYIFGTGEFNFKFSIYRWLHHVILIGFTEEFVFRGFLFQKIQESAGFWVANIISAVLFVLIHFPRWYTDGILLGDFIYLLNSIVFAFVFSLLQGYLLKRTKSLWACMIVHSLNNMISIAAVF